jgi:hypothetical protein
MSEPLDVEIDGSGSGNGIRTLISQLREYAETLDGDTRYQLDVRLQEVTDEDGQ